MLGTQGRLCRVRADRRQAQECVEIETRQPTGVAAHAQIPFYQPRLARKRQSQHQPHHGQEQRRASGIEPDHAGGGGSQFTDRAHQLATLPWQKAQPMQKMSALCHVREGPALKVAVPQQGQLAQKSLAHPHLELAARRPQSPGQRPFDEEEPRQEHQQRARCCQTLFEKRQALANVDGAAENQRLHHGPYPGERQTGEDGQEAQKPIGAQELDQFPCRARLVIGQHRGKLGRQRLRWLVRGSARHPQRERPTHQQRSFPVGPRGWARGPQGLRDKP